MIVRDSSSSSNSSKGSNIETKREMVYDPVSRIWKAITSIVTPTDETTVTPPDTETGKDTKSKVDSKTEAEKEYIKTEFTTLVGDMSVVPSKKSIKLSVCNTIEIKGLGKYLSGNFFVSSIKRSVSKDGGYSQSLTVMKNGFGDSLKDKSKVKEDTLRKEEVEKSQQSFKVGDTVRIVGKDAVYSNGSDGVKVPDWVKKKDLTIRQISKDETRVLLMPITSWTYVKYIQKV